MKKLSLLIILFISVIYGCENDDIPNHEYNSGSFVAFKTNAYEAKENASQIKIPVMVADKGRDQTVEVAFNIAKNDSVAIGTDFELLNESKSLSFQPGEGVKYIQIAPVNTLVEEGDKVFEIELLSNSKDYQIGMPGPDNKNASCTVTIIEDDCAFVPTDYTGNITGYETPVGQTWWVDCPVNSTWSFVEEAQSDVYVFDIAGFWMPQLQTSEDWAHEDQYGYTNLEYQPVRVTFNLSNPANPTYSIEEGVCATFNHEDEQRSITILAVEDEPLDINTCGKSLTIDYTVEGYNSDWASNYIFRIQFDLSE